MVDYGNNGKSSRFVCPDDRQLALRAKLKTGWSVKSASTSCTPSQQTTIGCDEQQTILDVIKRAEKVDNNEQERVGRLVDRLENMRRNVLGRNPSQCLICGEYFGLLGPQKVSCVDCKMLVCQKCSIENCHNIQYRLPKDQWLCMICVESREIWKKSGAWFFKKLPTYILPAQVNVFSRGRSSRRSRVSDGTREDESSSDEDRKPWRNIERRNKWKAEALAEGDLLTGQNSSEQLSKEYDPLKCYMGQAESRIGMSSVWEELEELSKNDTNSGDSSEISRRESVASRSVSELYWTDSRSDEKLISPCASIASSQFKPSSDHHSSDPPMGSMELSLTYDPITSTLHCTIYRAKNLIPMDINGLADPFCKLNILPNPKVSLRLRTKTVHKTRNPEFNENVTFYDISDTDLACKYLCILLVDDDRYGHDYMGEVRLPLGKLKTQNTIYLTVPLEKLRVEPRGPNPQVEVNEWFDDMWLRGQILLSLSYNTKKRALLVTVLRCMNLLPMDNNGFSDPFVKLHLTPDPNHRKHKTTIKWKNLNPIFNEEFAFETRPTELSTQSLYLTVWDKDYGKSNDYLGGLILGGVGSKGQRLKHWLDMIKYPDHKHVYWHNLTDEQLH